MKMLNQSYSFSGFVTIYFFFLLASLIFHSLASPTLERNALLEFKNEFPIPAPCPDDIVDRCLSSWNTSTDHCSWEGITCDDKSGEVISLFLSYIYLNGSLKSNSSLFKLQHLRELNLIHCDLIGEIPSSLGNLFRLTELRLSENHLVGEVPASLGNLNQLELLSLSSNNLTGNIPISFANFNKLSDLDLSRNQFTNGDFSRLLANLTSLSKLDLSHNHFKSKLPADMSGLQNLERLDASGNSFFGNVPTSLFTIPSLVGVYLRENQFEGPLEFGETSFKLLDLDLAHNNLIGTIPESISQLVNLSSLDLSHNNIIGTIPRSMSKLASLESLDLSYNKLEGQVPSFLWSLYWVRLSHNSFSSLENSLEGIFRVGIFELASNSLQGLLPQCICNSTRLNLFDVSNNHLTGSIPSCLKNAIAQPTYMILRNNNFTGVIPDIFIDATQLQSLDLSRNQLVGRLPKSLMNCSSLRFLNVKGNKIKDTFPYWLKSLEFLRLLLLGSNAFYGPIYSSAYVGFPTLRVIDISHNRFNGTLPQNYFANWLEMSSVVWIEEGGSRGESASPYSGRELHRDSMDMMYKGVDTDFSLIFMGYKAIDFSGNKFQGRIPKSIGLLKDLRLLNLSGNAFTGNIPSSLANITNLEALDLSRNKLSGQIPHDLGNLSFLSYLDFSHNHLQGPVPRSTQFQRQNCSSFEDNLGLSGLEDICRKIHVPDAKLQLPEDFSSEPELDLSSHMLQLNWIAAAVAYVPGVFCGLVIGHIFTSHKHKWFMEKFGRTKPSGIVSVH